MSPPTPPTPPTRSPASPVVSSTAVPAAASHELDAPPWLRVDMTLMNAAAAIRTRYDERLAVFGLSLSTASLLAYVTEFGPVSQTRAAEHLGQGRAATGAQVDRLEALGLVERQPDADDRRVWRVAATAAGAGTAARIAECDAVLRDELRAGISRADRQQLARLLVRLQQNLLAAQRCGEHPPPTTHSTTHPSTHTTT